MDALANELNRRYEVVLSKVGKEHILAIRDYFTLLQENGVLKELLKKEKALPKEHYEYIWSYCEYFLQGVYYPMINQPELVEKIFKTFFARDEQDVTPIDWLVHPKTWRGVILRQRYIYRLGIIHRKLFAQLKDMEFASNSEPQSKIKPKDKLRFIEDPGILIINGQPIEFDPQTDTHKVLAFIFVKNIGNIFNEFRYAELAKCPAFKDPNFPTSKKSWERYRNALRYANQKIHNKINIPDLIHHDSHNGGRFYIKQKHIKTLGLDTKELG
jgi:hypothetical protein